jgi:hypothetical protein
MTHGVKCRAVFTWTIRDGVLFITDRAKIGSGIAACSVTTDAENVLTSIYEGNPEVRDLPIVYEDSCGQYDVMVMDECGTVCFIYGGGSAESAFNKARKIRQNRANKVNR